MKILEINSVDYSSTGRIMLLIAEKAYEQSYEVTVAYPHNNKKLCCRHEKRIVLGSKFSRAISMRLAKFTGLNCCFSIIDTLLFLKKVSAIKPDVIHMHNLHNNYINIPLLFRYIKKNNVKTIWTLHDCWPFTGHCPYFDIIKCKKWITGCYKCPIIMGYPVSYIDQSKLMWKLKQKWFSGINDMTIVTPSQWLADLVKQSFLSHYPVKVINNGIDLDVFKQIESDFKEKYKIKAKYIVLGVSFSWGYKKGLDVFIELSKKLRNEYQIVLVGTDEEIDKKLNEKIISIHRTNNQKELAEIYSAATVFLNPTREENYPTVNMESIACGTPVITFNTGGSPEIVSEKTGVVLLDESIDTVLKNVENVCQNADEYSKACLLERNRFDYNKKFDEYIRLY